jgi:hypothetical protein
MSRSIVVLGGPDSGKSNYIARLWPALENKKGELVMTVQPPDIDFVLEAADHLFQGQFIQRSEHTEDRRTFEVTVAPRAGGEEAKIVIPDVSGEIWRRAVSEFDVPDDMKQDLHNATGALLFIREGSDQNVEPLDWVTSRRLLGKVGQQEDSGPPTQVMLCELIRFLEISLSKRRDGGRPRLAVVVAAWDLVSPDVFDRGPAAYLAKEHPMLAGRLANLERLEARVFGLSIVGGDLGEAVFREEFLEKGLDGHGWVAMPNADAVGWHKDPDVTKPIAWAIGI